VNSPTPQPAQYDDHVFTTREQLLFKPSNDFNINFIGDYTTRSDHCCAPVDYQNGSILSLIPLGLNNAFPGSIPNPATPRNNTAYLNQSLVEHIHEGGVSAQVNWTTPWFNRAQLTSITAWRLWKDNPYGDSDYTAADLLVTPASEDQSFRQFSQELRYSGVAGPVSWQVGAFYSNEDLGFVSALNFGADLNK
jgi:hypothetical protein